MGSAGQREDSVRERKREEASDRRPEMRENGHYSDSVGHHGGPRSGMATAE